MTIVADHFYACKCGKQADVYVPEIEDAFCADCLENFQRGPIEEPEPVPVTPNGEAA